MIERIYLVSNVLWSIVILFPTCYVLKLILSFVNLKLKLIHFPQTKNANFILGDFFSYIAIKAATHDLIEKLTNYFCCGKEGITRSFLFLGGERVMLYKPETVKAAISNKILDKGKEYDMFRGWLGDGLIVTTGEKWHRRRKILTQAFHFQILEDFLHVMNEKAKILVNKLNAQNNKNPIDIYNPLTMCALDIIVETSLGRVINAQEDGDHYYAKAVLTQGQIAMKRRFTLYLTYNWIFRLTKDYKTYMETLTYLNNFSDECIALKKKEMKKKKIIMENSSKDEYSNRSTKNKRLAVLDLLLKRQEEDSELTDLEIRYELNNFVLAGHDTTGSGMSFAVWLLGNYPEKQKLVHEEMDQIFGDSDRLTTSEDLKQMKYLECVIKETLRLFPPLANISKKADHDVQINDKYTIPSRVGIYLSLYVLHRDPKHFPSPENFEPERFLPENSSDRHPFSFMPFSGGPRNCIGQRFALMEEKVVLSSIFRKLRAVSVKSRSEMRLRVNPVIMPEEGRIDVQFYPR